MSHKSKEEINTHFDLMREKLQNDFGKRESQFISSNQNFEFLSVKKKIQNSMHKDIYKTGTSFDQSFEKKSSFLTPLMFPRDISKKVEDETSTVSKSYTRKYLNNEHAEFIKKYIFYNGIRQDKLRDVFDVLRLENPEFMTIDNKIRTLLCLIKSLVIHSCVIQDGSLNTTNFESKIYKLDLFIMMH